MSITLEGLEGSVDVMVDQLRAVMQKNPERIDGLIKHFNNLSVLPEDETEAMKNIRSALVILKDEQAEDVISQNRRQPSFQAVAKRVGLVAARVLLGVR